MIKSENDILFLKLKNTVGFHKDKFFKDWFHWEFPGKEIILFIIFMMQIDLELQTKLTSKYLDLFLHPYIKVINNKELIMKEIFLPINQNPNYLISNYGNVKSIERHATNSNSGSVRKVKPQNMVKTNNGNGYLIVGLSMNGKRKNYYVHRLVAQHFIPNPLNKKVVNHKDFNKTNNFVKNLEWLTAKENINYTFKNNRVKIIRGEQKHSAKITECQVKEIRKRINNGEKLVKIAEDYSISAKQISSIKHGRKWAWLK